MRSENSPWLVAWLCAALAGLGLIVASFGPLLPELAEVTGAPAARVGLVISALFGGTLLSQLVSALAIRRYEARVVIAGSLCATALGSVSLASAGTVAWLLVAGVVTGLGYGLGAIAVNLLAVRMVTSRPGFVVNLCNVCYGLGAVAGPLLSSALLRQGGRATWVLFCGAGLLLVLAPVAFVVKTPPAAAVPSSAPATASVSRPSGLHFLVVYFVLFGGVEAGFSSWLATYAERTLSITAAEAAVMTSQYWGCYLAGRCLSTLASLRVRPEPLLAWTTGSLVAGGLCLVASVTHAWGTLIGVGLLGLATGPIYPLAFATATRQRARAASAAATVATAGSLGGTVLPWVMGLTLDLGHGRGLAASMLALALGMAVVLQLNHASGARRLRAARSDA